MSDLPLRLARRFQPRHVLIVLGAVMASFLLLDFADSLGFTSLRFFDLNDSDVAARTSLAAVVVGGLLLGAAAMAFSAASTRRGTPAAFWLGASGALLALLGVDAGLGVHTWLHQHGVSWAASYLPFVALGALAWLKSARHIEPGPARHLFLLGIGAFLGSAVFDAARAGEGHSYALGVLLAMGAGALFLAAFVAYAHEYRTPRAEEQGRSGDLAAIAALANRLDPVKLALGAAVVVVALGVMGSISHGAHYIFVFDLNKEGNYPSVFSGLALWAAAVMAICNGVFRHEGRRARRWWIALAVVFLFLGVDETVAIHEQFQHVTNVWGQTFLLPIVVVGVTAWYIAFKEMRTDRPALMLWVGGASLWFVSQVIDLLLNEPMPWTVIPEELGEMTGSLLFAFALLVALRTLVASEAPAAQLARTRPVQTKELQPVQ